MSLSKVIETARADLGYTENPPGSNRTKYGEAYGMNGKPWCVEALWFWFNEAGERMAFFGGGKTASCGVLLRWYREQGLVVDKRDIQIGDILILNFSGTQDTQHCGLVVDKGKLAGTWYTVEGNTTPGEEGSQDDGGCVALKMRSVKNVVAVCHPTYKADDPQPVDDVTGHWFTPSVEWAREKELIKNYPDGSFKPNQPITRAEACVMFERFYQLLWEDDMR
jgi:hypothetical protein